ncbi:MAG: helix-turn-helix domain containing protein [Candidatus Microbacterium phytovorans]|uniref:Helix-turn-helix domain containing protein n=1 Tax=Candidatus Microbacterium phytovorans TaxID=3121374 RepID=A0AAJ6B4H5_9MICO|nr:TetR/AcrR family transcriptional regulator [Microbacterium sp.]WEK12786.1 MAG: helix-turn-helix domain containing protein [Microbacterium sp.]
MVSGQEPGATGHERRRRQTEEHLLAAAGRLFLRDGYARTSLAAVAREAGVAERTVYVRFATKAALFQRVIETAIVGDVDPVPLPERGWSVAAMSAPTLAERVHAFADGVATMNERLGPLMAVNGEVEPAEPSVQESAARWREATRVFLEVFWGAAVRDGLLAKDADVAWLASVGAMLSAAESRLLAARTFGWDRDEYAVWLERTWMRLAAASALVPGTD